MSLSKVQVESDIVAPYPTTVGNSKFRQSNSSSSAVVEGKKSESKMMSRTTLRNKLKLLRNLEQTLAVKRSFLKSTRSCKGTSAHLSSSKNVTPAPKLAARRKLAMIKCNSLAPTFARIRTRRSSVDCLPTNHKGSGSLIHSWTMLKASLSSFYQCVYKHSLAMWVFVSSLSLFWAFQPMHTVVFSFGPATQYTNCRASVFNKQVSCTPQVI